MNKLVKSVIAGVFTSFVFFLILGFTMAVIPNNFFSRMTPVYFFDWFFLILNSLLIGVYVGIHFYERHEKNKKSDVLAIGGGLLNVFVVGCPVCNSLIVYLLGTSIALNYFAPIQPLLGAISTLIISAAIYFKMKSLKECKYCVRK